MAAVVPPNGGNWEELGCDARGAEEVSAASRCCAATARCRLVLAAASIPTKAGALPRGTETEEEAADSGALGGATTHADPAGAATLTAAGWWGPSPFRSGDATAKGVAAGKDRGRSRWTVCLWFRCLDGLLLLLCRLGRLDGAILVQQDGSYFAHQVLSLDVAHCVRRVG